MRVLQAIQELRTGGAERVLIALTRGAQAAGHEVAVAAAPGPLLAELDAPSFPLPLLGRSRRRLPLAAAALDRALRRFGPDVLHCHNPGVGVAVALATLRGRRTPSAVTVHGVPDEDYADAARALRIAGLPVVACGPGVAAALAEHGVDVRETIVNGVTPAPPAGDRAALLREWGLDPGARLLVAVGRLAAQKDHATALHAVAELPDVALVVLGEGELRGELEGLVRTLGLEARVRLPGARPDARAAMAAADAVVLSSRWEGLPLVGLEALASGAPLVATAARGVRELVRDGETAVLAPVGDPAALARAIRRVLDDRALARRIATDGAELAAGYSEQAMVHAYLRLYEELAR